MLVKKCENKNKCGGCFYINEIYEDELKIKQNYVYENLKDYLSEAIFEDIVASPINSKYKNKMEFSFGNSIKDGPLILGLHEKKSFYNICSVENCELIEDDMREVVKATEQYFRENGVTFRHKKLKTGYLRNLVVRRSYKNNNLLVNLVTATDDNINIQKWVDKLLTLSVNFAGICHTVNDQISDTIMYTNDNIKILYGQDFLEEELLGLKFNISLPSFFQTNSICAEKLYSKTREYLLDGNISKLNTIFDLYCGTGTISQIVSSCANKVYGVEIVEEAVNKAKENAKLNNINNVEFICEDVLNFCVNNKMNELNTYSITGDATTNNFKNNCIILDPPRSGVHPKALSIISNMGAERIVYVSCKCESLKRDLLMLAGNGYKLRKVCPVDMFPRTNNVECVTLLQRMINT